MEGRASCAAMMVAIVGIGELESWSVGEFEGRVSCRVGDGYSRYVAESRSREKCSIEW